MSKVKKRVPSLAKLKSDALRDGKQLTLPDGSVFNSTRTVAVAKAKKPPKPNIEPAKPASAVPVQVPTPPAGDNSGLEKSIRAMAESMKVDSSVTHDLLKQIKEKKPTTIQRHGWRFTFHRDAEGFTESIDADPKLLN